MTYSILIQLSRIPVKFNSRKLPYVYYKNKISITMCDVSKGWGGGGGRASPEKRTYDVSHGHIRYVRLP